MTQVILVEADHRFTIVAIEGPLDIPGVGAVELKLTTHTVARHKPAVIDLREVQILTSLAIGMLVRIAHAMRAHGLGVALVSTGRVKEILEVMALGPVLPVHPTPEEALRALGID